MSVVITRLFDTYEHASQAVGALEASGVPHSSISLIANNSDGRCGDSVAGASSVASASDGPDAVAEGAGTGATVGTVLGGGAGLLAGLGMLAIPGIGPVVAAGWLVATALGASFGAGSGGVIGSLVGAGMSHNDAHVCAEGVRRGGTLVTVRTEESLSAMVEAALSNHPGVDLSARSDEFRRKDGWSRFDERAPAYAAGGSADIGSATPI
jgi:hypothetical protein